MKILKTLIALLAAITLSISLFTLLLLSNISSFFKTENIQTMAQNTDVIHELKKIQNSSSKGGGAEISDIVSMAYREADKHAIPSELVDEIFKSNEVKIFIGKLVGNMTDYIVNDNQTKTVTSEEFNKLLDDNIDTWIKKSNTQISDSKKEVLLIRMKSAAKGVIDNLPTEETVNNKIDKNTLNTVQTIFSPKTKIILTIIIIISTIIIILTKKKNLKFLPYTASSIIVSAIPIIILSLILTDILSELLTHYNMAFMASTVSSVLSHHLLITGIITAIIAIILYIIYYIKTKNTVEN